MFTSHNNRDVLVEGTVPENPTKPPPISGRNCRSLVSRQLGLQKLSSTMVLMLLKYEDRFPMMSLLSSSQLQA